MPHRPPLLFIAPTMPRPTGNGLAMRAAHMLDALCDRFDIHLFVVPVAGGPALPPAFVRERTVRIGSLDLDAGLDPHYALIARVRDEAAQVEAMRAYPKPFLSRHCTGASAALLSQWMGEAGSVRGVHVMRLYLAPLAEAFARRSPDRPFSVLDLDEDEVATRERIADLQARNGEARSAAAELGEARKYEALAGRCLPGFDRVLVSSAAEMQRLGARLPGAALAVVQNGGGADSAARHRTPPRDAGELRLLFVGALGYYPNEDAALFLGREIVPALRRLTTRRLAIDIVGGGAGDRVLALQHDPDIRVHGFVEDLAPLRASADVAVVPVRAGGGTRVKVLEAFAHRVPVVSTRLGAEGLDAVDGAHLLLADEAQAFASACLALKDDEALAAALAERAAELFDAAHARARLHAAVARVYDSVEADR